MALKPQASLPRCRQCGDPEVVGICHDCRRPVCQQHSYTVSRRLGQWLFRNFAGLGLEGTPCGPDPLTCTQCRHRLWTVGAWLILIGSSLSALTLTGLGLGLILFRLFNLSTLLVTHRAGLAGFAGLGLLLLLAGFLYRGRRPFLPLLWRPGTGLAVETLKGEITFDSQARLQTTVADCSGRLTLPGHLAASERQRVKAYRSRFRIPATADLSFRSGFALLKGRFTGNVSVLANAERHGHVLRLQGWVQDVPFLSETHTRDAMRWDVVADYTIPGVTGLPVRLLPHLVETHNERTLAVELQWDDLDGLSEVQMDSLRLEAPAAWGAIIRASDGALTHVAEAADAGAVRTLTWHAPPLDHQQRQLRRRFFEVQLQQSAAPSAVLRGQITMTWKGAFSRLEGIGLFFPLGRPDTRGGLKVQSKVEANFALSLAGLRYQEVRHVPDAANHPRDRDKNSLVFSREIAASQDLVTDLIESLVQAGYEMRRVVEAAPQGDSRRGVSTRRWDVTGRSYDGVCAVDFHVAVSGEAGRSPVTQAQVTARGLHTHEAGERAVERTWKRLCALVAETLGRHIPRALVITGAPADAPPELISESRPDMDDLIAVVLDQIAQGRLLEGNRVDQQQLLAAPATTSGEPPPE
ncbi:MAG: hypothetical protein WAV79_05350 [Anaerolineae bacterium]